MLKIRSEVDKHHKSIKKQYVASIFSIILVLIITALPGSAMAGSTFYIVSPAVGSDNLLEFTLDNIVNEIIEVTNSTPLTLNNEVSYFFTNSLAFSPTGELYAWSAKNTGSNTDFTGQLFKIDKTTGTTTNVPIDFNVSSCCIGTEFDPDTGKMITIRDGGFLAGRRCWKKKRAA